MAGFQLLNLGDEPGRSLPNLLSLLLCAPGASHDEELKS